MSKNVPQAFENHARLVPAYHFVAFLILVAYVGWSLWQLVRAPFAVGEVFALLFAVAVAIIWFYARVFALTAQDRIIRLEMRLRLQQLLPDDLKPRIGEFSVAQLVGLRFASDAELPALARKVLEERIEDRKAVKRLVRDWQGDYLRV